MFSKNKKGNQDWVINMKKYIKAKDELKAIAEFDGEDGNWVPGDGI